MTSQLVEKHFAPSFSNPPVACRCSNVTIPEFLIYANMFSTHKDRTDDVRQFDMSEFARGWRVLLGSFIGIGAGASSLYFYSLGLFLKPLATEFEWSRGEVSLGPFTATLGAALFAAPTGMLIDRIGPLATIVGSMALLISGFAALGLATQGLTSFVLLMGLLGLSTVGTTSLPYSRLIVGQFDRIRGVALGVALSGPGVVGTFMPSLLAPFIAEQGWRAGYFSLAATGAIAIIPAIVLLRGARSAKSPQILREGSSGADVFATSRFQLVASMFLVGGTGSVGGMVHLAAMTTEMGADPHQVGLVAGAVGASAIGGRLISGFLLDHLPAKLVAAAVFLISSVGVSIAPFLGLTGAFFGAVLLGLSFGAEGCLLAYLISRLFPPVTIGRASGGAYALFLAGGAIGQGLLGWVYDYAQSYHASFLLASGCLASAGLMSLALREPSKGPQFA